jgi:protein gp37
MSDNSGIEWTDATWTPVKGCTRVSAGCDNCYAVKMTHRLERMGQPKYTGLTVLNNRGELQFNGKVVCDEDVLTVPLRWRKPKKIFVSSMSDIFHKDVPFEFIDKIFAVMALCTQHTFQVLTKRPERMAEYVNGKRNCSLGPIWRAVVGMNDLLCQSRYVESYSTEAFFGARVRWPLRNVWLGTSVEEQTTADERIPHLLACPAAVRFLSCEPLLGPVDLNKNGVRDGDVVVHHLPQSPWLKNLHWVIVGGESGPGARPCDVAWIRSIVKQCKAVGVACFVKQVGAVPVDTGMSKWPGESGPRYCDQVNLSDKKGGDMAEWPADLRVREIPGVKA